MYLSKQNNLIEEKKEEQKQNADKKHKGISAECKMAPVTHKVSENMDGTFNIFGT